MQATTTTAPQFIADLVAALDAALTIQVTVGWPGDVAEKEGVYVAGVQGESRIPTMSAGRKQREETYEVKVVIDVIKPASSQTEALTQATEHFNVLENILADDPTLSALVNYAELGRFEISFGLMDRASYCRYECGIEVTNRLV